MSMFLDSIFRSYDIRGLVEGELSEELAYCLGRAYVRFLKEEGMNVETMSLVVGRDMRKSGDVFYPAIIRGITDEGVNVTAIGYTSTPLFNFACAHYDQHAGGIMITASHNPGEYNGFKLARGNGMAVGKGSGMETIRKYVEEVAAMPAIGGGQVIEESYTDAYLDYVCALVPTHEFKGMHVVLDAGSGMGNVTFPRLIERLGIKATYLYFEPDDRFPYHEANPLKHDTLRDLQQKVMEEKATFGLALDTDLDRIGVVDETGAIVDPSFVGALLGTAVLKRHQKATMLCDLRSSMVVKEVWEADGATVYECPVGHALIKPLMKQHGAAFASELSLHLYFEDMYRVESSDLCLLYLLELLQQGKTMSQLIAPYKKYYHSGEINFEVHDKDEKMTLVEQHYAPEAKTISHLDGVKIICEWGWISIRKSNTEPVLRLNLEATTQEKMEEERDRIAQLLSN